MSYLASVYLAALALFGALIVWALPAMFAAFVDWARATVPARKLRAAMLRGRKLRTAGRSATKPALPTLRASEISLH